MSQLPRVIESVWDYPRPPRIESCAHHLVVEFGGRVIAETRRGWRVCETSHPPTYYFPRADVLADALLDAPGRSLCEWKGAAVYFDVASGGERAPRAAWAYPDPTPEAAGMSGHVAFYCAAMDRCLVDGEVARPQPGGFYGGWVTSLVRGPFKGAPGTMGW